MSNYHTNHSLAQGSIDRNRPMYDLAEHITDVVNDMCADTATGRLVFNIGMDNQHRTLQAAFTRLCVDWLLWCADDDYRTDLRNEDCHTIGKAIEPELGAHGIRFI